MAYCWPSQLYRLKILPRHTLLPRKPLRAMIFRICSSSNATGRALEVRALRVGRERRVEQVARVSDSARRVRRTDPYGISNR